MNRERQVPSTPEGGRRTPTRSAGAPRLRTRQSRNPGEYTGPRSRTSSLVIPEPQALSSERSGSPRDSSTKGQTKDSTVLRPQLSGGPFGISCRCTIRQSARHHTSGRSQAGGRRSLSWLSLGSNSPPSYQTASLYLRTCFQGQQIKAHCISERQIMKN